MIRSFAALDREMEQWLHECGIGDPRISSGQRLQALANRAGELKATQRQRVQIEETSAQLSRALSIRNALVHGYPSTGLIGAQPYIFVRTLDQEFGPAPVVHCFTVPDIADAIADVDRMHRKLFGWRSQRNASASAESAGVKTAEATEVIKAS